MVWAQVRRRAGRTTALLAGILLATTGFTVLTGSTATSQLRVTSEVNANYRAAYDILVRPQGSQSQLEVERGLVRPNYLSGIFGGISSEQYNQVKAVAGVEVAAPVAMLGYVTSYRSFTIDLTDYVDETATRQLFRLRPTWLADRGLTVIDDTPHYVYVSRQPMYPVAIATGVDDPSSVIHTDGTTLPNDPSCAGRPIEHLEDGRKVRVCGTSAIAGGGPTGLADTDRAAFTPFQVLPDGGFVNRNLAEAMGGPANSPDRRLLAPVTWRVIMASAAIDPEQEARLVGLDRAVSSGRYLSPADVPALKQFPDMPPGVFDSYTSVPVVIADHSYLDESIRVGIERVDGAAASAVPGAKPSDLLLQLQGEPGTPLGSAERTPEEIELAEGVESYPPTLNQIIQSDPVNYDVGADGSLRPQVVPANPDVWREPDTGSAYDVPLFSTDTAVRTLNQSYVPINQLPGLLQANPVGVFDPTELIGFSPLARVPLETYQAPEATGADAATQELLGHEPLRPNSNPAGYLATPPLLLTTLAALPTLMPDQAAPISAIRVRVSDLGGFDDLARERVRLIAEKIAIETGLDVDITIGSSLAPQTVVLPAGQHGRPELRLDEGWSKKGVAVAIISAIDRKSVVLFGLILVVCVLFLSNAVLAAVRDRRRELAILACMGWSRGRLAALIVGEVTVVGLAGGAVSAALAVPLGTAVGVGVTASHALLAVPVALGLALLAALVPAWGASRAYPIAAIVPTAVQDRRARGRSRTVFGLALRNLWRVPGRSLLAVVALAVGVCALSVLTSITWAFRGEVTGSLLGDAVSLAVRGVDTVAVLATLALAGLALADVLYLNVRDRAGELAALAATGWSDAALGRLVTYEGILLGLLGAAAGAGLGLAAVLQFVGGIPPGVVPATAAAAAIGVALAGLAALIPTLLIRRLSLPALLAEE